MMLLYSMVLAASSLLCILFAYLPQLIGLSTKWYSEYTTKVAAMLIANHVRIDERMFFLFHVSSMVMVLLVCHLASVSFIYFLVVILFIYYIPHQVLEWMLRLRQRRFSRQLEEMMILMTNSLRTTPSMTEALQIAANSLESPAKEELAIALHDIHLGASIDEALQRLGKRLASRDLDMAISGITTARVVGSSMGDILEQIAQNIRETQRFHALIETKTAEGRIQIKALAALPVVFVGLIYFVEPDLISSLFTTSIGQMLLMSAIVLQVVGVVLMYRLVQLDV